MNTTTANDQSFASIAAASDNQFVVVWQSFAQDGSDEGIYAKLYNGAASPMRSDFRVNSQTMGAQVFPSVAMRPTGEFVIVWADLSRTGIYGQRYDGNGATVGGEFQISSNAPSTGRTRP